MADFGFAKIINSTTSSFCGTPDYIAPEIVHGIPYTHAVDWWSIGILIFELISGKTPFQDETSEKVYNNIQLFRIKWQPTVVGPAKDLVMALLKSDPKDRIQHAIQVKSHAWFADLDWEKVEARQIMPPFLPAIDPPDIIEKERSAKGDAHPAYKQELTQRNTNLPDTHLFNDVFKNY
jgi:serine/threonine protein kinase